MVCSHLDIYNGTRNFCNLLNLFPLQANDNIMHICRLAGIKDLRAKVIGSRNPINTVKATFIGLSSILSPQEIAKKVGKEIEYTL